jgi:hypothetical protein
MQFYQGLDIAVMAAPLYPFGDLEVGEGFLVPAEGVLDAFHQAITREQANPGWTHGRHKATYNSNVLFFRAS